MPSLTPQRRAPLSTRAHAKAKGTKTPRRDFKSQVSMSTFEHLDFFGDTLRESDFQTQIMSWSCDVHDIELVSNGHPLQLVAATLFKVFSFDDTGCIDTATFMLFMSRIEDAYQPNNAYHNRAHGADVTQTVAMFLHDPTVSALCTQLDKFAAVIAAAIHDVGHPGVNNSFNVNTKSELALVYNDISVLENMVRWFVLLVLLDLFVLFCFVLLCSFSSFCFP